MSAIKYIAQETGLNQTQVNNILRLYIEYCLFLLSFGGSVNTIFGQISLRRGGLYISDQNRYMLEDLIYKSREREPGDVLLDEIPEIKI